MILVNGFITPIKKMGGGIDENGNPTKPSEILEEKIPCRIKTNRRNDIGKINGNTFIVASYEVLIHIQPFDANKVKLERSNEDLGMFSVISIDQLDAVQATKILV